MARTGWNAVKTGGRCQAQSELVKEQKMSRRVRDLVQLGGGGGCLDLRKIMAHCGKGGLSGLVLCSGGLQCNPKKKGRKLG